MKNQRVHFNLELNINMSKRKTPTSKPKSDNKRIQEAPPESPDKLP
jgi:hypothetical protein